MARQVSDQVSFKTPLTQRGEFQLINRGDFRVIIDTLQALFARVLANLPGNLALSP